MPKWMQAGALIIGAATGLAALGWVAPWSAAADEAVRKHTNQCSHYVACMDKWETKSHAQEVNLRQDAVDAKLSDTLESLTHNVIKIGERLRVRDLRKEE